MVMQSPMRHAGNIGKQDLSRKCSAWKDFTLTLKKVCVVEVTEIIRGGSSDYMVCKPILVFTLSLSQAERLLISLLYNLRMLN